MNAAPSHTHTLQGFRFNLINSFLCRVKITSLQCHDSKDLGLHYKITSYRLYPSYTPFKDRLQGRPKENGCDVWVSSSSSKMMPCRAERKIRTERCNIPKSAIHTVYTRQVPACGSKSTIHKGNGNEKKTWINEPKQSQCLQTPYALFVSSIEGCYAKKPFRDTEGRPCLLWNVFVWSSVIHHLQNYYLVSYFESTIFCKWHHLHTQAPGLWACAFVYASETP